MNKLKSRLFEIIVSQKLLMFTMGLSAALYMHSESLAITSVSVFGATKAVDYWRAAKNGIKHGGVADVNGGA